jgi:hypothetical protein
VNSKEENSEDFCPDFIQEFGLADWLEENGPEGCDFIRDGRSMRPALTDHTTCPAQSGVDLQLNVHKTPS